MERRHTEKKRWDRLCMGVGYVRILRISICVQRNRSLLLLRSSDVLTCLCVNGEWVCVRDIRTPQLFLFCCDRLYFGCIDPLAYFIMCDNMPTPTLGDRRHNTKYEIRKIGERSDTAHNWLLEEFQNLLNVCMNYSENDSIASTAGQNYQDGIKIDDKNISSGNVSMSIVSIHRESQRQWKWKCSQCTRTHTHGARSEWNFLPIKYVSPSLVFTALRAKTITRCLLLYVKWLHYKQKRNKIETVGAGIQSIVRRCVDRMCVCCIERLFQ